nr:cobyrinic acid a,c-diamide synthase [Prauserella isguenensis]
MPGASELFRRTSNPVFGDGAVTPAGPPAPAAAPDAESVEAPAADVPARAADEPPAEAETAADRTAGEPEPTRKRTASTTAAKPATSDSGGLAKAGRRGSGRQKHDAKITVYLSGDELVAMEQARLALRASHDLAVDRGRIVREAVAVLLADFEAGGEDSVLVTRLRDGDLDDQEATN